MRAHEKFGIIVGRENEIQTLSQIVKSAEPHLGGRKCPRNKRKSSRQKHRPTKKGRQKMHFVSAVDIMTGIGWLQQDHVSEWRQGKVIYLERGIKTNLKKISLALKIFRTGTVQKGLKSSETVYLAWGRSGRHLRFSKTGNPAIERAYRTHYVSPILGERKQKRLSENTIRPVP